MKNYTYLGIIEARNAAGQYRISQRNKFCTGEQIEVMKPDGRNLSVAVRAIFDEEGQQMEAAPHPKQVLYIDLEGISAKLDDLEKYDILRRKEED